MRLLASYTAPSLLAADVLNTPAVRSCLSGRLYLSVSGRRLGGGFGEKGRHLLHAARLLGDLRRLGLRLDRPRARLGDFFGVQLRFRTTRQCS